MARIAPYLAPFVSLVLFELALAQVQPRQQPDADSPRQPTLKAGGSGADPADVPASKNSDAVANNAGEQPTIPEDVLALFKRLDKLGRDKVKDAKFVELSLTSEEGDRKISQKAWLVSDDKDSVTVLQDDLLPWKY